MASENEVHFKVNKNAENMGTVWAHQWHLKKSFQLSLGELSQKKYFFCKVL